MNSGTVGPTTELLHHPEVHRTMSGAQPTELEALLYILQRYSNLPEIYDFLSDENISEESPDQQFLLFLDRFGGMTLQIPPREKVAELVRDLFIYRSMHANPSRQNRERLAAVYHLPPDQIRQISVSIKKLAERQAEEFQRYLDEGSGAVTNVRDDRVGPGHLRDEGKA